MRSRQFSIFYLTEAGNKESLEIEKCPWRHTSPQYRFCGPVSSFKGHQGRTSASRAAPKKRGKIKNFIKGKLFLLNDAASVLALHFVREAPRLSLRRRAIETEISKSHLQTIFKQNRILPSKPKFRHTLEESDKAKCLDFCLEMGNRVINDVEFHKRILFSDE
ncbi:hypothetical protein NQ318_015128 [Aromia moschata]|uniref:Uncharacterized protein n=1 Tax=Aromia moschata TaxID=1265417 RepID=A0AAV8YZ56_9CUCU|nr:hypothetical protein NQ318_015128 [Aromia moschata]